VTAKDQRLGELGSHAYLAAMGADRQAEVMIPRVEPPRLPPDA
jgi:hypothetical protein